MVAWVGGTSGVAARAPEVERAGIDRRTWGRRASTITWTRSQRIESELDPGIGRAV